MKVTISKYIRLKFLKLFKHHIDSLFVYQMSKLWFYRFVLVLHEYLIPQSYRLLYLG